jgi:hypothetical protein
MKGRARPKDGDTVAVDAWCSVAGSEAANGGLPAAVSDEARKLWRNAAESTLGCNVVDATPKILGVLAKRHVFCGVLT